MYRIERDQQIHIYGYYYLCLPQFFFFLFSSGNYPWHPVRPLDSWVGCSITRPLVPCVLFGGNHQLHCCNDILHTEFCKTHSMTWTKGVYRWSSPSITVRFLSPLCTMNFQLSEGMFWWGKILRATHDISERSESYLCHRKYVLRWANVWIFYLFMLSQILCSGKSCLVRIDSIYIYIWCIQWWPTLTKHLLMNFCITNHYINQMKC